MRTPILPFLLILAVSLGCSTSEQTTVRPAGLSKNAVNAPGNAAPTPLTYDKDIVGQSVRIVREGLSDDSIRSNISAADKAITYEHLKKNADKYAGQPWFCKGEILEIAETGGSTAARIALDDWGNKAIYVAGPIETTFVEKNTVYVVGYLSGNYSYTSQANWNITVPSMAIRAMIKPADWPKYQKLGKK